MAVGELEGRTIAVSGCPEGTLRVWDLEAGAPIGDPLTGHHSEITAVAVGERIAVSASIDGLRVWDLAAGAPIGDPLTGHEQWVTAVAIGELDRRPIAVSGGFDGTVRVWDLAAAAPIGEPLTGHKGWVYAVAIGELDGRPIAVSAGDDATVRVWDLAGTQLSAINVGSPVSAVAVRGSTSVVAADAGLLAVEIRHNVAVASRGLRIDAR